MNRLKGTTCYLCGPMDRVPDGGVAWREDMTLTLKDFGVGVFNPCDKPSDFAPEDEDTRVKIPSWKELTEYLHHVDSSKKVDHMNRWRWFDFSKVYGEGSLI